MKKLIIIILSIICFINIAIATDSVNSVKNNIKKVFINQLIEHPALDITTKGIIDGLEHNGYKPGVNLELRVESAQANPTLASQIAAKFVNKQADVVVGVATIAAQSFIKYAIKNQTQLIFSSVTDPLGAGLIQNNISGVSNFVALEPQLMLYQKIQPNLKNLGFLYNPAEANSISIIKHLKTICPKLNINLILQAMNKTAEVSQATTKLIAKVDAIFISNDSTALSAFRGIINIANKSKKPVYVSDTDAVELGALAALGPNQYLIGIQTAFIIARSLNGEDLGNIPVEFPKETELYLNEAAAKIVGISIPDNIKNNATKVFYDVK